MFPAARCQWWADSNGGKREWAANFVTTTQQLSLVQRVCVFCWMLMLNRGHNANERKVTGTRGLGFFTCWRIQPYRPPSVTFSVLVSLLSRPLIICIAHPFFLLLAVLSPFTHFSPGSSLPLCRVIINQKIGGSTLGTLSSNSALGSILQHFKHALTVPVMTVPAATGRYSQTSYSLKLASDKKG